ncbi:MAG: ABC transporter substrate-binding protein, partial [Pseudomonadota bacterium]|nr:ABC transporter substrate-binding protein [Pseudomonadota bacterium]
GYQTAADRQKLIEAVEAMGEMPFGNEHPQGRKVFNGKTHQVFGPQYISKVEGGKLVVQAETTAEDSFYPDEVDYTTKSF